MERSISVGVLEGNSELYHVIARQTYFNFLIKIMTYEVIIHPFYSTCSRIYSITEILTGPNEGKCILIPCIKLAPSDVSLPFTLERMQFPTGMAYCMTINKSQGQTFYKLGIYLPMFTGYS